MESSKVFFRGSHGIPARHGCFGHGGGAEMGHTTIARMDRVAGWGARRITT